jgi:hypothetical protein
VGPSFYTGSISREMKATINGEVRTYPRMEKAYDPEDMGVRDKEKRRMKAKRIQGKCNSIKQNRMLNSEGSQQSEVGFDDLEEPSLSSTQLSAMFTIVRRGEKKTNERLKKPFSNSSLFNALLESQIGGEGNKWDLRGLGVDDGEVDSRRSSRGGRSHEG